MNIKDCYKQYQRGKMCARKYKVNTLYMANMVHSLYLPTNQSEFLSFCAGWDEARKDN